MKKIFAILLAVTMFASLATVASAAETTKTTTLTTVVPAATYTLNIPADQTITFGATTTSIGNVTITDSANFAAGKNVEVTITYDGLFASNAVSTTIPYTITSTATGRSSGGSYGSGGTTYIEIDKPSGSALTFEGLANGTCSEFFNIQQSGYGTDTSTIDLKLHILSTDWGKALAGEYTTTITFTCEVVVE